VLRGVEANNGKDDGVHLYDSSANLMSGIAAKNNGRSGVYLFYSSRNKFREVTTVNNGYTGVRHWSSHSNTHSEVTAVNNGEDGIVLASSSYGNVLSGLTVASNGRAGVVLSESSNNTLVGVTAPSNGITGVSVGSSSSNIIMGVAAVNNRDLGISLYDSSNNTIAGVTAADNYMWGGIRLYASPSCNTFTGILKVGGNGYYGDCSAYMGENQGLDNQCNNNCSSDANTSIGITSAESFAGKVTTNDIRNLSDTNGTASHPENSAYFDWVNFENPYRGWGKNGSIFPAADHQGQWTSGTGRIWDWSATASDTVIRNTNPPPTGNDTLTHIWSNSSTITFLRHALELEGNGNGLCESGEICLYTPNIGAYQGHGDLVSAGPFTNGAITNVTLMQYQHNGR
jgi:parallel beta-helix repeat protein